MTTKELVEREKQRRETANARMREKVAAARRRGICRCGGKLDKKPGTRRNYSTCPDCREKAVASATRCPDDGVKAAATNSMAVLTGIECCYDPRRGSLLRLSHVALGGSRQGETFSVVSGVAWH
jgi:hypothetical protein